MRVEHAHKLRAAAARSLTRVGIGADSTILAAVSGGPDSVALLRVLLELRPRFGYRLCAAHLNHGLRASESDRDEAFVARLCDGLGVEIVARRAHGLSPAKANLEERARQARHAFLNEVAGQLGATHIALGHHRDDQAETVLMRLLRGAGATGLRAMSESGPGRLIRPLLEVSRRDIVGYLAEIGADFVEDSTNRSSVPLRNRIRRELLPMLESGYAPGIGCRLSALGAELHTLDEFVVREARRALAAMRGQADGALDLARFAALDPALRAPLVRALIADSIGDLRRIARAHVDAVVRLALDGPAAGEIALPRGWCARRQYDRLFIERTVRTVAAARYEAALGCDGVTEVAPAGFAFHSSVVAPRTAAMPLDHYGALFDRAALGDAPIVVRNFRAGDRIEPLGVGGSRKLKEVFIDARLPRAERVRWPVVTIRDEPVWIPGLLRSSRALVTSASESVVQIRAQRLRVPAKDASLLANRWA